MRNRKNAILLLMVVLIGVLLTACSSEPTPIGEFVIATEEMAIAETTEVETTIERTETTEDETCLVETESTQAETFVEETETTSVLQIQSLEEGFTLDKNIKLPYEVKMHEKSTNAIYNPVIITEKSEGKGKISFSFISEEEKIYSISYGLMIQNDEKTEVSTVKRLGDIQTFSIIIPYVKDDTTVLYQINMSDDNDAYYFAIQIEPQRQQ